MVMDEISEIIVVITEGIGNLFEMIENVIETAGNILEAIPRLDAVVATILLVIGWITLQQFIDSIIQQIKNVVVYWWVVLTGWVDPSVLAIIILGSTAYYVYVHHKK